MYACKQCGTGNPLDSSFCKKCGAALPADELSAARVKLAEMLDEGNNLFTEGRTDEAMLIAEAAVAANPSSHMAYSLKGLCHERLGQIGDALECYETAVSLNADSSLDKVKVAALRNRLAQRVNETPEPSRRNAAMIGVAAAVLFLVGGSLAAIGMSGKKDSGKVAANTPPTNPVNNALQSTPPQTGAQGPGTGQQAQTSQNSTTGQPTAQGTTGGTGSAGTVDPGPDLPPAPRTLPNQSGSGLFGQDSPPITLEPQGPIGAPVETPPAGSGKKGIDPDPKPLGNTPPSEQPPTNAKPPEEDHGYIHIEMAPHAASTPGGSEAVSDGNGIRAMLEAANQSYQTGKFDAAAGRFAQVASMGGNSPKIQQRLGDCYQHLGKPAQARTAYNRAITMYQAQIKQGSDVARNQAGLDVCESALKVLGG